ncbi:MAG: hypothetical protein IJ087_04520, partial [Eggerthellaceae bacterium]|nr:hypothetical protein [Eggerthellaceae bacterium]
SGVRGKLAEMLGVLGCTLVGDEGVGIALDGQAFATNELALSEEDLTALGDHVEMFLAALEG